MTLLILTQKVNAEDAILGFFVEWIDRMAGRVDRLKVIALEKGPCDLPDNVEVISLGKEKGRGGLAMLLAFQGAMWRLCRKERPDAVFTHMVPRYVLYAAPMARLFRVPIDLWYTHKGVDRYLRMAHPFIRYAFTASEESFRLPSPKKVVTGHGIDTEQFKPDDSLDRSGILTVGRITPSKDQEVLVAALALMKEKGGGSVPELRILGEPLLDKDRDYLARLKARIGSHALGDFVRFEGIAPHRDLAGHYQRARLMVNASHTGSVDKVVLEAMASGTLPLTCNESFVPLLGDLADRLIFEKHDAADLAERIEALLGLDEETYQAMARELRQIVKDHHDLDRLMNRLVSKMGESPGR
ncbi:MAG: glycosyltransferase family 4 protein [Planctomycetota bacterium]